ncbi:DUF4381 family protein [Arsukibacterium sp.]|uniref:DUF4381 family protein n=1 Tax=Arsukibacterium sp. TaxID=1977258 RepID=UPI002FD8EED1
MSEPLSLEAMLADIIESELSVQWQFAPVHWLLLLLAVLALAYVAWRYWRHYQQGAARRYTEQLLLMLDMQQPDSASQINQLLKMLVQHYAPAHPLLTASVEQWQAALQQHNVQPLPDLASLLYQDRATPEHLQQFRQAALQFCRRCQRAQLQQLAQQLSFKVKSAHA